MSRPLPPAGTRTELRLTRADFDAFAVDGKPTPATLRAREELRERVLAWARGVVARLSELDVHLEIVDDGNPRGVAPHDASCRVVFLRDENERGALTEAKEAGSQTSTDPEERRHASLALQVDGRGAEVALQLFPEGQVDGRNLRARIADPERALELAGAFAMLPEQFAVDVVALDERRPAPVSMEGLSHALGRAAEVGSGLWLGWRVPREVAIKHSSVLAEQLEDAAVALGPTYKLIAWARDNDLISLVHAGPRTDTSKRRRVKAGEKRDRASWAVGEGRKPADPPRQSRRREAADDEARADSRNGRRPDAEPTRAALRELPSVPLSKTKAKAPHLASRPALHATLRTSLRTPLLRPKAWRRPGGVELNVARPAAAAHTEANSTAAVERGSRVRVLAGPFVGKMGLVQELDGKGGARVMLGLLAARLDVKDLVASADGRERPALSSSHRKPLPVR